MPVMPSSHTSETNAAKYCRDEASVNLEIKSCIKIADAFSGSDLTSQQTLIIDHGLAKARLAR